MSDDCAEKQTVETEIVVEGKRIKVRARKEAELPVWEKPSIAGHSRRRVDGLDKVTGKARYTADQMLPGMLHGRVLRSPHARARALEIHVDAARRLPGVLAVLTPGDVSGIELHGQRLLVSEPSFPGEEIVAVAATEPDIAEEALSLVRIRWEKLPHVVDADQAMRPDAPKLQPGGNVIGGGWGPSKPGEPERYERGDTRAALARAALTLERSYETPAAQHASMETHGAVALWDGDGLTVWESTQGVFFVRAALCDALGLPAARVRVLCPFMGGGFGGKTSGERHTVLAALLSRQTGRPVRMVLPRSEDFTAGFYRPASRQAMKIGMSKDGRIEAIELSAVSPVGANKHGNYFGSCDSPAQDFYGCANVKTENRAVFTNSGAPSAFRAPGHVQGAWGLEQLLDEACDSLGLDPVEVRLANLPPHDMTSGQPFASNGLRACIERGAAAIGWKRRRPSGSARGRFGRGLGMAIATWGAGGGPPATAQVIIHHDGSVVVATGACDLGTGTRTVFAQIAAEELGIALDRILVANADTRLTPYCLPSFGSLTLASSGPAVRLAAHEARRQLLELAAPILGTTPAELTVEGGQVRHRRQSSRKMPFDKVAESVPARMIVGTAERGPNPNGVALVSFAAHFAEVEVDTELGNIRVRRFVAAHDSGRILNPATWTSQIHGGILQGLGYALLEERLRDPATGVQLNSSLLDYKVPTLLDAPGAIEVIDAAPFYPGNNINAKGSGEPPIIPAAPAIANAVANAIGARLRRAPMTPARVLEALGEMKPEDRSQKTEPGPVRPNSPGRRSR